MREIREIVVEVESIGPEDPPNLDHGPDPARLDALTIEYFSHPEASRHLDAWLRVFERFPESDGFEVFWSILHGLEAQPRSGEAVVASVLRRPTTFPVLMINRLLNGGVSSIDGVDLLALLGSVADDERAPARVREDALGYLAYQHRKA